MHRRSALLLLILVGLLLVPQPLHANAPAPGYFTFDFVYETSQSVTLEGVQLVSCAEEACSDRLVVAVYGECRGPDCAPMWEAFLPRPLQCSQEQCRADLTQISGHGPHYYLVLQLSDGTRATRLFGNTNDRHIVRVQDEGVVLRTLLYSGYRMLGPILFFVPALLVTWVVESIIVWLYLSWRGIRALPILLWLLPMHLGTVPLVWFVFPSFSWAPTIEAHTLGVASLGVLLLLAAAAILYQRRVQDQRAWGIYAVAAVVLVLLLCATVSRQVILPSFDLPPDVTTLLAEITIVLVEAWFLRTISRGAIPWLHALLVSAVANVVSYGGGQLLWLALQQS